MKAGSFDRIGRFLAVMSALCALAAFPASSLFDLTEVTVRGTEAGPAQDLLRRAGIAPGESAFRVNAARIRERVLRDPRIQDVTVVMTFPRRVAIIVRERPAVAALRAGGGYVLLGADGVAIAPVADPGPYLLLEVDQLEPSWVRVGTVVPSADVRLGAAVAGMLPVRIRGKVAAVRVSPRSGGVSRPFGGGVSSGSEVLLRLRNGVPVRLGGERGLTERLRALPDVLSAIEARGQRVEYVDVRFTGTVVIKPVAQPGSHPDLAAPGTASPGRPAPAARPTFRQENPEGR